MKREKLSTAHALGLHKEGSHWTLVHASLQKGTPHIHQVETDLDVKRLYTHYQKLCQRLTAPCLVTALSSQDSILRPLNIRLGAIKEIDEVLAFQAEPLLPCPVEDCILDRFIVELGQQSRLTLVAAQKTRLATHLKNLDKSGFSPEVLSCVPAALATFCAQYSPNQETLTVIHLGSEETCFALVHQGNVLQARTAATGCHNLLSLDEELSSHQDADTLKRCIIQNLLALNKQNKNTNKNLFLCGPGATSTSLTSFLKEEAKLSPTHTVENSLSPYAIPIGLALSALDLPLPQINFRQEEFSYPHPWKRYIKPLITFGTLSLLLSMGILLYGHARIQHAEIQVKEDYLSLLATLQKPPHTVEEEFLKYSTGEKQSLQANDFSINTLDATDIQARVNYLESQIQATPDSFPLQPNIPRVADVLAWISQHPKVVKQTPTQKEALIHIESFAYNMVKRPDHSRKNEHYKVKIEIEFTSSTPTIAREFHDALIDNNVLVDPKGEVKWSSSRGRYKTSFFLKDKTTYSRG